MAPFSLLAVDIDGTLLDGHGRLPPENVTRLQRCIDRGFTLALATGRNLTITRPIAQAIGREMYLVLQDGCLLLHYPSLEVLAYHNLPLDQAQAAGAIFRAEQLPVMLFDPLPHGQSFTLHTYGPPSPGLAAYLGKRDHRYPTLPAAQPLTNVPSKIVTLDSTARVERIYHQLRQSLPAVRVLRTEAVRLEAWFLEVGPRAASKAQTLAELLQYLGCTWSTVIAIGDAENDVEMLQAAGLGVAMGNASARVRAAARQVIGSNVAGGLAHFLQSLCGNC